MMTFGDSRNVSLADLSPVLGFPLLAKGFFLRWDAWVSFTLLSMMLKKTRHFETAQICWFAASNETPMNVSQSLATLVAKVPQPDMIFPVPHSEELPSQFVSLGRLLLLLLIGRESSLFLSTRC